jgi:hypothetical protein
MAINVNHDSIDYIQATQAIKKLPHDYWLRILKEFDILLHRAIAAARIVYAQGLSSDPYRGLHIGEEELKLLQLREPGSSMFHTAGDETEEFLSSAVTDHTRLASLQNIFGLSLFDLQVIVVGLAPELDLRYERLYSYLQDDVTRKRPTVDLVLNLLCPTFDVKMAARERFLPNSPLAKNHLLQLFDDPTYQQAPLLSKCLRVDERVVNYLLGSDELDSRLLSYADLLSPQNRLADLL